LDLLAELPAGDIEVLSGTLLVGAFWDRDKTTIKAPANEDLGRGPEQCKEM